MIITLTDRHATAARIVAEALCENDMHGHEAIAVLCIAIALQAEGHDLPPEDIRGEEIERLARAMYVKLAQDRTLEAMPVAGCC